MENTLAFNQKNIKQALTEELAKSKCIEIEYRECRLGNWNTGKFLHYINIIGSKQFEDKKIGYADASALIESVAKKMGLIVTKETVFIATGSVDAFRLPIYNEVNVVTSVALIKVSKTFDKVNKWLVKHGLDTIGITDIFSADNCRKRSSDSFSNITYHAENETYFKHVLEWLRAHMGANDTITMTIDTTDEWEDGGHYNYESERYGMRHTFPHFIIKTPKGKVKAESDSRYSFLYR